MDIYAHAPSATARKCESGTPPIPNIYAGNAGMDLMHEIGIAATERHVGRLTAQLIDGLDRIGATIVTPRDPTQRGPMLAGATTAEPALGAAPTVHARRPPGPSWDRPGATCRRTGRLR